MRKNQLEAVAPTGMIEGKRVEEDKGKRSWTGYLPHVEINGTSTKFWKFVKTVMSICWSPTSESDMALASDRIVRGPRALKSNSFDFRDVNVLKSEIYFFFSFRSVKQRQHNNDASVKFSLPSCCETLSLRCVHNTMTAVVSSLRFRSNSLCSESVLVLDLGSLWESLHTGPPYKEPKFLRYQLQLFSPYWLISYAGLSCIGL